jgi:hypothetical protein
VSRPKRAPAWQFYPDRWLARTMHLSPLALMIYQRVLCWMWIHSPDYCSIKSTPEAICYAALIPLHDVSATLIELLNPENALLVEEGDRWISPMLRDARQQQIDHAAGRRLGGKRSVVSRKKQFGSADPRAICL